MKLVKMRALMSLRHPDTGAPVGRGDVIEVTPQSALDLQQAGRAALVPDAPVKAPAAGKAGA